MKQTYDFSNARPLSASRRVPTDAVLVRFNAAVSSLFLAEGTLAERLGSLARSRRSRPTACVVSLTRAQYRRLRSLIEKLDGKIVPSTAPRSRKRAG